MKVLHSGTLDVKAGGPAMSAYYTLCGLRDKGVDAQIIMFELDKDGALKGDAVPVHFTRPALDPFMRFSFVYKRDVLNAGSFDVYHAQGVWQWPTYALVDAAKSVGKPYLITPRGMLYPQDIAKSNTWLKELSLKWRLLDDLNNATCVHVTCEDEMRHCRNLGVTSPIAVIPNPVEIRDYNYRKEDDIFRLGYLGRVSRRKNIHGLIKAFIDLGEEVKDAELLIIGGGDDKYMSELMAIASNVKYGKVLFPGFLNGEEKNRALASCSVLAMPSEFENLGNVILEGLVRRIPCIATTGAPWSELNTEHCGWQVPYEQSAIADAVRQALHTSKEQLAEMGNNGRLLMERRYSVESVASQMSSLYEWVLGSGNRPDFVFE